MSDEGRDIERAHADDRESLDIGREFERAALLLMELRLRLNACACEQRQSLVEDASLGDGESDRTGHDPAHLGGKGGKGNAEARI